MALAKWIAASGDENEVHYPSKNLNKTLVGSYQTLGKALAHGVPSQIAKAAMNCPTVRIHFVSSVIKAVSKEVSGLCSPGMHES